MPESLRNAERTALIALLLAGGEVSGKYLREHHGLEIRKDTRERLNDAGLIRSNTKTRSYTHKITAKGVAACEDLLASGEPPTPASTLVRVCCELFVPLLAYFRQREIHLADVLLESVIREAYGELSEQPRDVVRLADLRARLDGAAKDDVDRVLRAMTRTGLVHLTPSSNRKGLTDADHAAAIRIGSEDKHLVVIEES